MGARSSRSDRSNVARGRWGEDLAASHYRRNGYTILARNWRGSSGELDLILERDGTIVFSEVKARRSARHGSPAWAVGPDKQRRIRRLAVEWLQATSTPRRSLRFDVVTITGIELRVIEAAF
ncbi:MAG: YraN family protein [Ilumatobacter sp.]|uniref:YraN family protein n=1 Tax=Ilumatobacter sp. TaxID=1967498 RepID=UPI00391DCEDB